MTALDDLAEQLGRLRLALQEIDCDTVLRLVDDSIERATALGSADLLSTLSAVRESAEQIAGRLRQLAELAERDEAVLLAMAGRVISGSGPLSIMDSGVAPIGPRLPSIKPLAPARRAHILDGDRTGGGHRSGAGLPGKSEFPARWSDEQVIAHVVDVARHPARTSAQAGGRLRAFGERDGVEIKVVIESDGSICTAHPLRGRGIIRNPREEPQ